MYFHKQAKIKAIYDELEEKQTEKVQKKEEDVKMIEEIERQVADLETEFKRKKDALKDNHEVKIVDSGPLARILVCFFSFVIIRKK